MQGSHDARLSPCFLVSLLEDLFLGQGAFSIGLCSVTGRIGTDTSMLLPSGRSHPEQTMSLLLQPHAPTPVPVQIQGDIHDPHELK